MSTIRRLLGRSVRPSGGRRAKALAVLNTVLALPFIVLVLLIAAWWLGAIRSALNAPGATFQLERVAFTLPLGMNLTLGRAELMQRPGLDSAELNHVRFEYTAAGEVRISNVAKQRRLGLLRDRKTSGAGSADRIELTGPLGQTTRVGVDGQEIVFRNVTGTGFDIDIIGIGRFRADIGLGWNRLIRVDAPVDVPICQDPGWWSVIRSWVDNIQARMTPLLVFLGRDLDQTVLSLGGDRSCKVGQSFQLALTRTETTEQLIVSMVPEDRWGVARRLFLAPAVSHSRSLITVERFPPGCPVGNAACRSSVQPGFSGASWLVAHENAPASRELSVWRFIAGRTAYSIALSATGTPVNSIYPAMRVAITPLSNSHQFSLADCAWFMAPGNQPPFVKADEDKPVCPERPRDAGAAFQLDVKPTQASPVFDRQMAVSSFDFPELMIRRVLLVSAVGLAFLLAVPIGRKSDKFPRTAASFQKLTRIWPVLMSVAIAALPDPVTRVSLSSTAAFTLTIANWAFAGCVLAFVPRTGRRLALMWAIFMGLAAIGSVSLATFGGDVGTTKAAGFLIKHKLMFLDLLPPFALAIVTASQQTLRPLLASIVLDNRRRFWMVRWLPALGLLGIFLAWLAVGTQTGLGSLQPVEGGKFLFIVIVGAILVSLERGSRAAALRSTRGARGIATFIVLSFLAAVYLVPFLRNDYSPILIISSTGFVLVIVRFLPDAWRWFIARFRAISERMHLPMRLRPAVYEPLIPVLQWPRVPRGAKFFAGIILSLASLVMIALVTFLFGGAMIALALNLERIEWPSQSAEQEQLLESSLGIGRRVPIERVLAWIDLDLDAVSSDSRPRASYRDIDFQVIRSRVEIENANCQMSDEMRGAAIVPGLGTFPGRTMEKMATTAAWLFGFDLAPRSVLCKHKAQTDIADTASTILDPRGAETIPVGESDFAAAYLIARHGITSAVLLLAFQFAFFVLAVVSYIRLIRVEEGDASDLIVRYLLSILLAATTALFVIQWCLAWANTLGLLPVMGQPMTWLSSGTSHHLLMALPCAVTILLSLRYTVAAPARRPLRAPPL